MATATKVRSLIWHPHQGLWNWRLVRRVRRLPGGALWDHLIVVADSVLLAARLMRPATRPIAAARVLYIDGGVHQEGWEIQAVADWFGGRVAKLDILAFEANPAHCTKASNVLRDIPSLDLRQAALVGPGQGDSITLYLHGGAGKSDSLFAEREREGSIQVPAVRLSKLLPPEGDYDAVILRMNIEGAEEFVIDDLADAGVTGRITAYYGMWDDLSKIDRRRDREFRVRLQSLGIHPVTFNDRDFENPQWPKRRRRRPSARLRLMTIRNHMTRAIGSAVSRNAESTSSPV